MLKNKQTTILMATILMIIIAIPLFAVSAVSAQLPERTKKTHAYIGAVPNPVGLGQETLLHVGITDELELYRHGWEGLTVTVTKPDGATETLGPLRTDSTGGTGTVYIPTMIGNYTLQTHFPEQNFTWSLYGGAKVTYQASSSPLLTLVVQETQREHYPGQPLPSEYWKRPIDGQFREWHTISANWLTRPPNRYAPHNQGPETAHILWAKPLTTGGLVGGELGHQAFEDGDAYEGKFQNPVIIGGTLYINRHEARGGANLEQEIAAIDIRTGEELWARIFGNNERLAFGQTFYWDSFNYHGAFAYLWTTVGSTWRAYDAHTGRWVYTLTNVPSGSNIYGPKGEIYRYTINLANGWMTRWNSSRAVQPQLTGGSGDGSWRPHGNTYNALTNGIDLNVTIPKGLPGSVIQVLDDRVIGGHIDTRTAQLVVEGRMGLPIPLWGISTKPGQEGQLLFNTTWTPPPEDLVIFYGSASLEDGVFTLRSKESRQYWGFSLDTGQRIWGPTTPQPYLDVFGMVTNIAYGKLITGGFAGKIHAYDVKTGELLWAHDLKQRHDEVLWSENWPLRNVAFITDGKIYWASAEHSPVDPKLRGSQFWCLDIETGEEIWGISFFGHHWQDGQPIIADSIIIGYNSYDQQLYAFGKGPSATTVTAPDTSIDLGKPVLIKGTITDISTGTKDHGITARFPNGVPAVDDAHMSEWMEYVYMQFPRPTNIAGVPVTIDVVDSNGNYRNIGTTTSDDSGFYSLEWQPDISGKYTVITTFEGSKSYWPSYAQTAFTIIEASQETPAEQPQLNMPPFELYLAAATAAIIAAIAIVGLLLLRKRP